MLTSRQSMDEDRFDVLLIHHGISYEVNAVVRDLWSRRLHLAMTSFNLESEPHRTRRVQEDALDMLRKSQKVVLFVTSECLECSFLESIVVNATELTLVLVGVTVIPSWMEKYPFGTISMSTGYTTDYRAMGRLVEALRHRRVT